MGYPFIAAKYDYGPRKGPALALVIHMAEGGNTVSYLHNAPARGVSVHFVAEYSGRIVQMLGLDRTSGSINPATLRTDDGPPPYGASVARSVLGNWYMDPNSAVISLEIEGFARTGPNVAQNVALRSWANDMRLVLGQLTGALGHRDFQNVKPCPGALIDWNGIGGHGLWHGSGPEVPMAGPTFIPQTRLGTATIAKANAHIIKTADGTFVPATVGHKLDVYGSTTITDGQYSGQPAWLVYADGNEAGLLLTSLATYAADPPSTDCTAQVAAEHERTRQQCIEAVTAVP